MIVLDFTCLCTLTPFAMNRNEKIDEYLIESGSTLVGRFQYISTISRWTIFITPRINLTRQFIDRMWSELEAL